VLGTEWLARVFRAGHDLLPYIVFSLHAALSRADFAKLRQSYISGQDVRTGIARGIARIKRCVESQK
jgi:hypothetical protein